MGNVTNTFVKSKMNKDLDDRLLSNGEYRNAKNVNISRSEGEDVGALENVLGNQSISTFQGYGCDIIGMYEDDTNQCVYSFLTNWTDPSSDQLSTFATETSDCFILKTYLSGTLNGTTEVLVAGRFLNFSKTHHIYGIDLIEDLLFWTDDRNQPRKINVKLARSIINGQTNLPSYYTNEDQISVAKYYPYKVCKLWDEISITITSIETTTGAPGTALPDPVTGDYKYFVSAADIKKIKPGMPLLIGSANIGNSSNNKFVVAVFDLGASSYFLGNVQFFAATLTNVTVALGITSSTNSSDEFKDYSIIGELVRNNGTTGSRPIRGGPLLPGQYTVVQSSGGFVFNNNTSGMTPGTYLNVNANFLDLAGTSTTPTGKDAVFNVTVNSSGKIIFIEIVNGGTGFNPTTSWINITAAANPSFGGSGELNLIPRAQELLKVDTPNVSSPYEFFWTGSSIPYTKMLINVPGFTNTKTTITAVEYFGRYNVLYDTVNSAWSLGRDYFKITPSVDTNVTASSDEGAVAIAEFSWPNPDYISSWPGDKDYLKEKFVRFSYRFKFVDGEYSLIAPFTQPAFIPKQQGFIQNEVTQVGADTAASNTDPGNVEGSPQNFASGEESIQASTIVSFFENSINNVSLEIEMPHELNQMNLKMHVEEIDIIYRESDGLSFKVLETIPSEDFSLNEDGSSNNSFFYNYNYQSRRPFRTLPAKEVTRVFDKVPIRAKTQSSVGNRIVYGNFLNKHTPLNELAYSVKIAEKSVGTSATLSTAQATILAGKIYSNSYLSYPTHTIKQNRTYQVGFVFSDRFGRQSDVILSSISNLQVQINSGESFDGSTIFNPYFSTGGSTGIDSRNIATWRGDNLQILLREAIPETITYADGYPGLYNSGVYELIPNSTNIDTQIIINGKIDPRISIGDIIVTESTTTIFKSGIIYINYNSTSNTTTIEVDDISEMTYFSGVPVYVYGQANLLGWYSYKIVVKQLVNDYYNAYLGNVSFLSPSSALLSDLGNYPFSGASYVSSLLSDNVNKIPADLGKVSPEQVQFGTSDEQLFPLTGATTIKDTNSEYLYATNFDFGTLSASINAYGKIQDIGVAELAFDSATPPVPIGFKTPIQSRGVQSASSNPPAIIFTMPNGERIGREYWRPTGLYIFEVKPKESRIDIFWETSTCGLISDLNKTFSEGPVISNTPAAPPSQTAPPGDAVEQ